MEGSQPIDPYADGLDAAYLQGRYTGCKPCPPCPFAEGSPEAEKWHDGFGDGTSDLIHSHRLDVDDVAP